MLTKEGKLYDILRNQKESKLCNVWYHLVINDGMVLPFFWRHRGSNHYLSQRVLNLFWLIMFITSCAAYCVAQDKSYGVLLRLVLVSLVIYIGQRHCFQRIRPDKLMDNLPALLSDLYLLIGCSKYFY